MRKVFFVSSVFYILTTIVFGTYFWPPLFFSLLIVGPIIGLGIHDSFQTKKAILRNFPVIGHFRYLLEELRPEIHQYFIESDSDGSPVPRETRSVIYQRAKLQLDTLPFGTQKNVYSVGYEWISHSMSPDHVEPDELRVKIGNNQCAQPYSASIFNISAMSYGALSQNAILALNGGAKLGGFYHNTGEGGLSPHHLQEGGDIVWQIGTGYFGCRTNEGRFCPDSFQEKALLPQVKMIELKISQGAKPSHGGILPASKITQEIVEIRKVAFGKDVVSPPSHSEFSSPKEMLLFLQKLRALSGGKPVGFKFCFGQTHEFMAICKAMIETGVIPDFITVDGGEGGTGAAPMEFSNNVGAPLEEGLALVHDILIGFDLRKQIKVIASGKVMTGFNLFSRLSLGADLCNTARGMMLALGCIQARQCNTNRCPTGVATSDSELIKGLVPSDKKVRIYNYHKNTVKALAELMGAAGVKITKDLNRHIVNRRTSSECVKTYAQLFPYIQRGCLASGHPPEFLKSAFDKAASSQFSPQVVSLRKVS